MSISSLDLLAPNIHLFHPHRHCNISFRAEPFPIDHGPWLGQDFCSELCSAFRSSAYYHNEALDSIHSLITFFHSLRHSLPLRNTTCDPSSWDTWRRANHGLAVVFQIPRPIGNYQHAGSHDMELDQSTGISFNMQTPNFAHFAAIYNLVARLFPR